MKTKQPINFNPCEASNFASNHLFVIQGKSGRVYDSWQDSKYGGISPYEAIKLARTLDICMTENTKLRVVKRCKATN